MTNKNLDAIIIPGVANEDRMRKKADLALEYKEKYGARFLVATGGKTPALSKQYIHEAQIIYEELRKKGVKPIEMKIEGKSRNNIENILYSLEKLKNEGIKEIGIISYPSHLDRFDYIIEAGKKEGSIDKNIEFYRIETDEKFVEKIYEIFARFMTRREIKKNGVKNAEVPEGIMKKIVNPIVKLLT